MADVHDKNERPAARFTVFRGSEAIPYDEADVMHSEPLSPVEQAGAQKLTAAGYLEGIETKLLFSAPGFSLTHLWFKSGAPLPRHAHNCDCLYYVAAGSLHIGAHELAKGDGFFVGADVPYAYVAGDAGVEVLEFRASNDFNIKLMADNPRFWAHAAESVAGKLPVWATEGRPSAN